MRRRLTALCWVGLVGGVFFASCLARRDKPFQRITDDDAGPPPSILLDGALPDASPDALDLAPHAVLGVDPPHGPHVGGTLVMIRGNGFDSSARVWFGEVEATKVTPVDPQRIQVVTSPGAAGAVDIVVQNGSAKSTRAVLPGGYTYDRFYATPSTGPTSGGTIITVIGEGTEWDEETYVEIDGNLCEDTVILGPHELKCRTPSGEAGAKVLSVVDGDGERQDVLDGFLYGNSDNGFRGGLSGQPIAQTKQITVLAFDEYEGHAIPGISVLVGDSVASGQVEQTDGSGVATFSGDFGEKQTITLAGKCWQPMTFFDVGVERLTAYLEFVPTPDCAEFEPPPGGGTFGAGSSVAGEVVWPLDGELKRGGWTNVPSPAVETEKEVAYVLRLSDAADEPLRLPSSSSAITPEAEGGIGYSFYHNTSPGNFTLYALAGIEDRSKTPAQFTAYAMGLLRGVAVKPGKTSDDVFIEVDVPLDHSLTFELDPPPIGARGPDRVRASVAIQIEDQGFALLPNGVAEKHLPGADTFSFVGVPPLVGSLAGTKYVLGARAVTGPSGEPPLSVIGYFPAVSTAEPHNLGGFVPAPVLAAPAKDTTWDLSSLRLEEPPLGGQSIELTLVHIVAGGDLYKWTLVAPREQTDDGGSRVRTDFALPNLRELNPDAALPGGSMRIFVTYAHIDERELPTDEATFDYGSLRYRQLAPRGWNAYAADTFLTQH
jgi:hypothetical protein